MLNRRAFRTCAPMHVVYKSKQFGTELWLGDYYAATDYNLLKSKNIQSVLTAAAMLGVAYPTEIQMNHKTIQAFDIPSYKMTQHFEQAYNFIHEGLKKGHVLVHCAAGISRSTTCVLVYMMRQQGYMFNQALQIVRAKRSIVNPNYGFQSQLKRYQAKLKNKKQVYEQGQKQQIGQRQKRAVLNFLKQKNQEKNFQLSTFYGQNSKLNATLGYSMQNNQIYSGLNRGKSVNTQKRNPMGKTIGFTGNQFSGQNRLHSINSYNQNQGALQLNPNSLSGHSKNNQKTTLKQLNNQFLTFKLEAPKIVTIKK